MEKSESREQKKPYTSPELSIYGTVSQLTQHKVVSGHLDHGPNFEKTG